MLNPPHLGLLRAYGNEQEYFTKTAGGLSATARVVMGLISADRGSAAQKHREQERFQEEELTHLVRAIELAKMQEARAASAFSRPRAFLRSPPPQDRAFGYAREAGQWYGDQIPLGMDGGMVRLASAVAEAVGQDMAQMDKEAAPNFRAAFGSVAGRVSQGAQGLVQKAKDTFGGLGALKPSKPIAAPPAPPATPPPAPAATPAQPSPPPAQPPAPGAKSSNRLSLKGLAGGVGALALGYGAMKTVQKGMDILGREAPPERYGSHGPQMAYGTNQYGQPQMGSPFQF